MVPVIDYRLAGHGWSECTIRFRDVSCEISASYLSDALGRLVLGATSVAAGLHAVAIGFDVEPGEYRWSVTAIGPEFVRVQILSFPDLWSYEADTQGRLLLAFECEAWEFAAAVRDAALRVRDAWPGEAYCDKWGEHEFPTEALALLEARLGNPAAQG